MQLHIAECDKPSSLFDLFGDERAVKQCRRVATRYDKLAANYLAFVQLASISMRLRVSEYTT